MTYFSIWTVKNVVLLLTLFTADNIGPVSCIYNGTAVLAENYSFVVAIYWVHFPDTNSVVFTNTTGILLSPTWVITDSFQCEAKFFPIVAIGQPKFVHLRKLRTVTRDCAKSQDCYESALNKINNDFVKLELAEYNLHPEHVNERYSLIAMLRILKPSDTNVKPATLGFDFKMRKNGCQILGYNEKRFFRILNVAQSNGCGFWQTLPKQFACIKPINGSAEKWDKGAPLICSDVVYGVLLVFEPKDMPKIGFEDRVSYIVPLFGFYQKWILDLEQYARITPGDDPFLRRSRGRAAKNILSSLFLNIILYSVFNKIPVFYYLSFFYFRIYSATWWKVYTKVNRRKGYWLIYNSKDVSFVARTTILASVRVAIISSNKTVNYHSSFRKTI